MLAPFYRRIASLSLTAILSVPGPSVAQTITPGEVLFKIRTVSAKTTRSVSELPGIRNITPIQPVRPFSKPAPLRIFKAEIEPGYDLDNLIETLRARADIEYAQPNHVFLAYQATNDPRLNQQPYLDLINWPDLLAVLPDKQREVIVGIIDSGIDYRHEDLAAAIWLNEAEANGSPGIDDDGNGYVDDIRGWDFTDAPTLPGRGDFLDPDNDPMDESSHGTGVAGVIGAISNNGIGVAGVADCRLMAVRAGLSFDQGGTFLQEDDLAAAMLYAVDNGADILNLSWGSFDRAFVLEDAIRYAVERGVVVIAAAGNEGEPPVGYPAALDDVISVSAVGTSQLAGFSSYGPTLDLAAPGVQIFSTGLDDAYGPRSGSSFAAPQVAGLAALLLSRRPDLTSGEIRGALVSSTTDLGPSGWDSSFGSGRVDASQLVKFITGSEPTTARIFSPSSDSEVTGSVNLTASTSGANATGYRLSWSLDNEPASWTLITSGSPTSEIETSWLVPADIEDAPVVLRLEVDASDEPRPIEHRVRLRANASTPFVSSVFYGPILAGDRVSWTVRWVTRAPTLGHLILLSQNGFVRDTIRTAKLDRFHEVILPDQNTTQSYEFQIVAEGTSGQSIMTPLEPLTLIPARIPSIGFTEIATLPDGFLADQVSDFDGNGRPEIAVMPYVEGEAYSPVQIFEYQSDGTFSSIHTTEERFLPWNVGDVTHDGTPDLLGSSIAGIQLMTGFPLPTDKVFDQSGVWGGEIADADGDGANEILARSIDDYTIRVYRLQDNDTFGEVTSLVDFSPGIGITSSRFVVADLDGDFKQDLLFGDADGDIWSYEFEAGGYLPNILLEGPDDTDATIIGGGEDLDGDGKIEFAVARAFVNDEDALNGWWDLEIYESTSNNRIALEWVQRISGVAIVGNGISTGDLDGDGRPELAVALNPDLYIIRADGPDTYRPIFHTEISLTYRPVLSDLDDDGAAELIFNADGAIRVLERNLAEDTAQRPEILEAVPLGRDRISLKWTATPNATNYRLLRTAPDQPEQLVTEAPALSFIDVGVSEGDTLVYRVEAVRAGETSIVSGPITVVPRAPPTIARIDRLDENRIAVLYNATMSDRAADPNGYRLHPNDEPPSSAIRDQSRRRIVLTFSSLIQEGVTHTLEIRLATDLAGLLIDPAFRSVTFTPGVGGMAGQADFDGDGAVGFGDFLLFAAAFGGTDPAFDLDGDGPVGFSDFLIFAGLFGQTV